MAQPIANISGELEIAGTRALRQRSTIALAAEFTVTSAGNQKASTPRARTESHAATTSVTLEPFAPTSSILSVAQIALPRATFASAFGSAGFHTHPTRIFPSGKLRGAQSTRSRKSASTGCMLPTPQHFDGRPSPARAPATYGPRGMLMDGGDDRMPKTCGRRSSLAFTNDRVVAVPSVITRS